MGKIKNKKLNRKGFTLIELLAVIVILAILILLAMPSVLSIMENSRKNALVTESESIINAAKTAYTSDLTSHTSSQITTTYKINPKDTADTNPSLENYIDKNFDGYDGDVLITFNASTGKATYKISISNGTYKLCGNSGEIKVENVVPGDKADDVSTCTPATADDASSSSNS